MSGEMFVTAIGNLTADPELRFTQSGAAVAGFTIAQTPRVFKDGEWQDGDPIFLRCSIWRQPAENVTESLTKGTRVIAYGKLKQRKFEKDGVERTVTELDVEEIGASTKFATVKVQRAARETANAGARPSGKGVDDPWGSAPASSGSYAEEPPF